MTDPYYPLKKTGKVYKPIPFSVLAVYTTDGKFTAGCLLSPDDPTHWKWEVFTKTKDLIRAVKRLSDKSWIISYGVDYIGSVLYDTIGSFTRITAWGEKTNYIELKSRQGVWYLIDIRIFFAYGIEKAGKVLYNKDLVSPDPGSGLERIIAYIRDQADLIKRIWTDFKDLLKDRFNIYPSKSPGSTALKIFKTTIKNPLKTKSKRVKKGMSNSIHAGALHWSCGIYEKAFQYDINASYPFAMSLISFPRFSQIFANHPPPSPFWIGTVRLSFTSHVKFSPLHIPAEDGGHYSVDRAENVITSLNYIDFQLLLQSGDLEIHEWLEGVYWEPRQAEPLFLDWKTKVETASLENKGNKTLLKIVSRALHSKFSQTREGQKFIIRKIQAKRVPHTRNIIDLYPLADGKLAVKVMRRIRPTFRPYDFPEYESLTLSMGRLLVYSAADENTVYIDTDSIISTVERPDLNQGPEFGKWKVQESGPCAIAGPRMYAFESSVKSSGIYTPDREGLKNAIWEAAAGKSVRLQAIEGIGMLDLNGTQNTRSHTIRTVKYPHVEVIGETAYITRSPTIQTKILTIDREFTIPRFPGETGEIG